MRDDTTSDSFGHRHPDDQFAQELATCDSVRGRVKLDPRSRPLFLCAKLASGADVSPNARLEVELRRDDEVVALFETSLHAGGRLGQASTLTVPVQVGTSVELRWDSDGGDDGRVRVAYWWIEAS